MGEEEVKTEIVDNNQTVSEEITPTEVLDAPQKGKKEKKPKSKARSIVEWVLTGIFGLLFLVCAIGNIDGMIHAKDHYKQTLRFGYGSFLVLTNSMEPKYKVNYALVTKYESPETIYKKWEAGKTIDLTFWGINTGLKVTPDDSTYNDPQYPKTPVAITHRLREIHKTIDPETGKMHYVFICSGINEKATNYTPNQYQAFTEKELLGVVKFGSPALGWVFRILSSPWGLLVFLLVPALYLVISSSLDILKALKDTDDQPATASAGSGKTIESLNQLSDEDRKRLKDEMLQEMMKGKGEKK